LDIKKVKNSDIYGKPEGKVEKVRENTRFDDLIEKLKEALRERRLTE